MSGPQSWNWLIPGVAVLAIVLCGVLLTRAIWRRQNGRQEGRGFEVRPTRTESEQGRS